MQFCSVAIRVSQSVQCQVLPLVDLDICKCIIIPSHICTLDLKQTFAWTKICYTGKNIPKHALHRIRNWHKGFQNNTQDFTWPADFSGWREVRHAPPSQEPFQKSTIEKYILHNGGNCISTVLYCVVIHMRSKVYSLCVDCYISGILWNSVARVRFGIAIFS